MNGPSLARRIGEILAWITIIGVSIYSIITLINIFSGTNQPAIVQETETPMASVVITDLTATAVLSGTGAIQIIIPTTAPNLPSNPKAPARATAAAANPNLPTETPYIVPVPTENITQTITMEPLTPTGFLTVTITGTPATATSTVTVNASTPSPTLAETSTTATVVSTTATSVATATAATPTATKTRTIAPPTATPAASTATVAVPTNTAVPTQTDVPVATPTP